MQNLSSALMMLYEAAEDTAAHAFPHAAVHLIRRLIRFDAAVLGMCESPTAGYSALLSEYAWVHESGSELREDYVCSGEGDLFAEPFLKDQQEPFRCECQLFFGRTRAPRLEDFARRHAMRQLMLFGSASMRARSHWIILFRRARDTFTTHEASCLALLFAHLERCLFMNRSRHLERQVREREARAAALLNWHGRVEAADPCFRDLIALEWPAAGTDRVSQDVIRCFRDGEDFEGARIRIALCAQDELIVCKAWEKNLLSTLTPTEFAVALQFSRGLTHKDVARKLGVSQNTVRSHIKHVYDKLAINSKARLAQLMTNHMR